MLYLSWAIDCYLNDSTTFPKSKTLAFKSRSRRPGLYAQDRAGALRRWGPFAS